MKRFCNSYVNKRFPYPFYLSIFFSFTGFLSSGSYLTHTHTHTHTHIFIYKFFCHEQCCFFEFPSLAIILKHICCFINFILFLMVDPLSPFVPALMTWVFKRESLCNPNTNSFFLSKTLSPFSLSSPFPPPQTPPSVFFNQILVQ